MITEDRLRELAHVARSFAQKTAAASLGGGGVRNEVSYTGIY